MATLEAIRGNESWLLSGGGLTFRISTLGLGLAPIRWLRQRGPFQHGVSVRGFRLDERTLNVVLFFRALSLADADNRRAQLAEIFKPVEDMPLRLRWTLDNGKVREIEGYTEGILDFPDTPEQERIGRSQRVVAPLLCPVPVWYDPTLRRVRFTNLGVGGFQVPSLVPMQTNSGTVINAIQSVAYAGDWRAFPILYVTGPADDVVITNLATGEKLDFTGATLAEDDVWTIDLGYEAKTIDSSVGGDATANLTEDSDLANWHLAAHPEVTDGINDIQVSIGDGATTATAVEITYYDRFISAA